MASQPERPTGSAAATAKSRTAQVTAGGARGEFESSRANPHSPLAAIIGIFLEFEVNDMYAYTSLADDYYVNLHLNTEMPLPAGRETVLGFFERVQKTYPTMRNFYTRDNGDFVLEEDKEQGHYRWISLEPKRICSGYVNPPSPDAALEQHLLVLDLIPYMLSVSPLDCEAIDLMTGFDFAYRGNHDALVAEALGVSSALEGMLQVPNSQVINLEPSITICLDEACRLQARLMVETRTNAYHVRRGDYPEEHISVYFTMRQYGSLGPNMSFKETLARMRQKSDELLEQHVVEQVLRPLQQAISAR
jgi:hypothetical protein